MNKVAQVTQYLLQLLPFILSFITKAEVSFEGIKQGEVKKAAVLGMVEAAINAGDILIDDFDENRGEVLSTAEALIDAAVATYNLTGKWTGKVRLDIEEGDTLE